MPFNNLKDICIGLGIILGVILAAKYFPTVLGSAVILTLCALIVLAGFNGLRKGSIGINARTKLVVYERPNNPVAFWFYVLFFIFLGVFICGFFVNLIFFKAKF